MSSKNYFVATLQLTVILALATPAYSTVIYDVLAEYGTTDVYSYSFSMEFADNVGVKSESDLISTSPSLDFFNEQFSFDGTAWNLALDSQTVSLDFDTADLSLAFSSTDIFSNPNAGVLTSVTARSFDQSMLTFQICSLEGPSCSQSSRQLSALTVTMRDVSIPEPSILTLMAAGLIGLIGFTRRKKV